MKFKNLLKNHWANFTQTWHKASLGILMQVYLNERTHPFPKGDNLEKTENILMKFKIFLQNNWANFNQTWHKSSVGVCVCVCTFCLIS